jgi:hypothetical protein
VRQPEQVAVRYALALAVLDRLVGERVNRLRGVPAAHRPPPRAAPAADALDERRELEQVRARARHLRQRVERRPARCLVLRTRGKRESEQGRVVLRRATPWLTRTISSTVRRPSAARQRFTASAESSVSFHSDA